VYLICWWCHEWRVCKFCNQLISDFIVRCCALLTHLLTHLHWKMPKTLPNFLGFPSFAVNNTKCHESFFYKNPMSCTLYTTTHTHTVIKGFISLIGLTTRAWSHSPFLGVYVTRCDPRWEKCNSLVDLMAEHAELLASVMHSTPINCAINFNIEHDKNKHQQSMFRVTEQPVPLSEEIWSSQQHSPLDWMLGVLSLVTTLVLTPSMLTLSWD